MTSWEVDRPGESRQNRADGVHLILLTKSGDAFYSAGLNNKDGYFLEPSCHGLVCQLCSHILYSVQIREGASLGSLTNC